MRVSSFRVAATLLGSGLLACGLGTSGLGDMPGDGGPVGAHDGAFAEGSTLGDDGPAGSTDSPTGSTDGSGGEVSPAEGGTVDSPGSDGPTTPDQTSPEASMQDVVGPNDAPAETTPSESGSETSTTCTSATGCYVIPGGWTLVAFAPSQGTACPTGFATAAPTNLVEGPDTTGACSCGACTIGTQPTCPTGPIGVDSDTHAIIGNNTCGTTDAPVANNPAGGCDTDLPTNINYSLSDMKLVPPAATGGQCSSAGTPGTLTYADMDRACVMDSAQAAGCNGDECTPNLPSPYVACVFKSGDVACPGAPFTEQHVVGTAGTLTCSACDCSVSADCTGTMTLYTDTGCTMGAFALKADTGCYPAAAPGSGGFTGTHYGSYKYAGNAPATVACAASGSSAASVTLANEQTVCCVQ